MARAKLSTSGQRESRYRIIYSTENIDTDFIEIEEAIKGIESRVEWKVEAPIFLIAITSSWKREGGELLEV